MPSRPVFGTIGIDIGESTGGIAVVTGNEIRRAETYTDYHAIALRDQPPGRRLQRYSDPCPQRRAVWKLG